MSGWAVGKIISSLDTIDYLRGQHMEKEVQQGVVRQREDAKTVSMGNNIVTFHLTGENREGRN